MTTKHDNDPTYRTWRGMKARCNNENIKGWEHYGGRGIYYEPRWEKYENFLLDMGPKPTDDPNWSLDRKNNAEGYSKENCRWAPKVVQANNKRLQSNNTTKITGVSWHKRLHRWYANGRLDGTQITLYSGYDFFEACCARKSWEFSYRQALGA